eukprot:6206071-Pleurochrysis_carterae.AAC.3
MFANWNAGWDELIVGACCCALLMPRGASALTQKMSSESSAPSTAAKKVCTLRRSEAPRVRLLHRTATATVRTVRPVKRTRCKPLASSEATAPLMATCGDAGKTVGAWYEA